MTMPIHAKDIPDLVHWYRGMLLMPEHFRTAAARSDMLAAYLLHAAQPFAWGVRSFSAPVLIGNELVIDSIEALLPDGTVIAIDQERGGAGLRLPIDKAGLKPELDKPADVYLALAAWNTASLDLDRTDGGAARRYRADPDRPPPTAAEEEDEAELGRGIALHPEVMLVLGTSDQPPRQAYTLLRVARLGVRDGKPALLEYEPPRVRIGDSLVLSRRIELLLADMHGRAAHLHAEIGIHRTLPAGGEGEATSAVREGGAQDGQIQALIGELRAMRMHSENQRASRMGGEAFRALIRLLPRLRTMLKTGASHPFDVYLALCDALGELALVSPMSDLDQLQPYDHHDPLKSFDALIADIRRALSVFDLRYQLVPFTRRSDTAFELLLDPEDLERGGSLLIGAVSSRARSREEQRRWLETAAIGLQDSLGDIRRRRVAGWERSVGIGRDPALGISETPQLVLARIMPDRDQIGAGRLLVIDSDIGEGPVEMNFYRPVQQPGAAADPRPAP